MDIGHALRDGLAGQAPLICIAFVWTQCAPVGAAAVFHVVVVLCNGGVHGCALCRHIAWNDYPPDESSARKTKGRSRGLGHARTCVGGMTSAALVL